jgi:hypothetical protein
MNTKLLTSAGCLLLLAAAIAPSVLGHSERPAALLNDYDPANYQGINDVSGRYTGASGPAIAIEAYNQASPLYNVLAAGSMLCDAEVVTDDTTNPANEDKVDGNSAGHAGAAPDTVDDGGQGGACHSNTYTTGIFNSFGCQPTPRAFGYNDLGNEIWLGASCDWKTDQGGTSSTQTFELCVVNGVLAFNPLEPPVPTGALGELQVLVDCVTQLVDCLLDPACGATGATETCGADHTADAIDFGYGMGNLNPAVFPANTGVYFGTPNHANCPNDGAAAVFVFDAVGTNGGSIVDPDGAGPLPGAYVPGTVQVYPAGNGDIWG